MSVSFYPSDSLSFFFSLSFVLRSGVEHQSFAHLVSPLGALPLRADSAHDTGTDTLGRIMSLHACGLSCFLFFSHSFRCHPLFEAQPWLRASILPTSSPSPPPKGIYLPLTMGRKRFFLLVRISITKCPTSTSSISFLSSPKVSDTTARFLCVLSPSSVHPSCLRLVCLVLSCAVLRWPHRSSTPCNSCSVLLKRISRYSWQDNNYISRFIFGDSLSNSTTHFGFKKYIFYIARFGLCRTKIFFDTTRFDFYTLSRT